jgi:pimeloyl-ACP methyl ester carboxylesterase
MADLLDHRLITERYFFPRDDAPDIPEIVRTRDGETLHCARTGASSPWTVVHFHGNGEVVADWHEVLGDAFADMGWSSLFVEFRGYGGSSGKPRLAAMLSDGEDAMEALGLDPARTVAFGRSIGSLYAVELAARRPLAGLILDSGIHDLAERLLLRVGLDEIEATESEFRAALDARFDQGAKLKGYGGKTLLLHAADDELVTVHHAEQNALAARDALLRVFPRGGHNAIFQANITEYLQALESFLSSIRAAADSSA